MIATTAVMCGNKTFDGIEHKNIGSCSVTAGVLAPMSVALQLQATILK